MVEQNPKSSYAQDDLERVTKSLRKEIFAGQRLPRERLVEKDLTGQYGVNRMIVRQVLNTLDNEGLVTIEPYKGASVAEISLTDVQEKYQISGMLEGYAAGLATSRLSDADLKSLEENLERQETILLEDVNKWQNLNVLFHRTININCGNERLIDLIRQNSNFRSYWFIVLSVPGRIAINIREHRELLQALRDKRPDQARALMESHIIDAGTYVIDFLKRNIPIGLWREES